MEICTQHLDSLDVVGPKNKKMSDELVKNQQMPKGLIYDWFTQVLYLTIITANSLRKKILGLINQT